MVKLNKTRKKDILFKILIVFICILFAKGVSILQNVNADTVEKAKIDIQIVPDETSKILADNVVKYNVIIVANNFKKGSINENEIKLDYIFNKASLSNNVTETNIDNNAKGQIIYKPNNNLYIADPVNISYYFKIKCTNKIGTVNDILKDNNFISVSKTINCNVELNVNIVCDDTKVGGVSAKLISPKVINSNQGKIEEVRYEIESSANIINSNGTVDNEQGRLVIILDQPNLSGNFYENSLQQLRNKLNDESISYDVIKFDDNNNIEEYSLDRANDEKNGRNGVNYNTELEHVLKGETSNYINSIKKNYNGNLGKSLALANNFFDLDSRINVNKNLLILSRKNPTDIFLDEKKKLTSQTSDEIIKGINNLNSKFTTMNNGYNKVITISIQGEDINEYHNIVGGKKGNYFMYSGNELQNSLMKMVVYPKLHYNNIINNLSSAKLKFNLGQNIEAVEGLDTVTNGVLNNGKSYTHEISLINSNDNNINRNEGIYKWIVSFKVKSKHSAKGELKFAPDNENADNVNKLSCNYKDSSISEDSIETPVVKIKSIEIHHGLYVDNTIEENSTKSFPKGSVVTMAAKFTAESNGKADLTIDPGLIQVGSIKVYKINGTTLDVINENANNSFNFTEGTILVVYSVKIPENAQSDEYTNEISVNEGEPKPAHIKVSGNLPDLF